MEGDQKIDLQISFEREVTHHWSDVVGMQDVKEAIREAVCLPLLFPQLFKNHRIPWKTILLFGAPGVGKTMVATSIPEQLKQKSKVSFLSLSCCDLISTYKNSSCQVIQQIFEEGKKSCSSVIFLDEIDCICNSSNTDQTLRRAKTELLCQLDHFSPQDSKIIIVIAATNKPEKIDAAIRKRFEKRIYVPFPSKADRLHMIENNLKTIDHELEEKDLQELAARTQHCTGSDICVLTRDITYEPVRRAQEAKYFKQMENGKWVPCYSGGGLKMELTDFQDISLIQVGKVTRVDAMNALKRSSPSVEKEERSALKHFLKQFTDYSGPQSQEEQI